MQNEDNCLLIVNFELVQQANLVFIDDSEHEIAYKDLIWEVFVLQ